MTENRSNEFDMMANCNSEKSDIHEYDIENHKKRCLPKAGLLMNVAFVTIANGADNIGVYIPLFTGFSVVQYIIFFLVFAVMTALWCILGYKAASMTLLKNTINKYKKMIVPAVYILLGVYIWM